MIIITTLADLRNWVDEHTSDWHDRQDAEVDAITEAISRRPDCPAWGEDWTEFFATLPDDLALVVDKQGDSR